MNEKRHRKVLMIIGTYPWLYITQVFRIG